MIGTQRNNIIMESMSVGSAKIWASSVIAGTGPALPRRSRTGSAQPGDIFAKLED